MFELSLLNIGVVLGITCLIPICMSLYNITFHPLAKVPGPKLWSLSQIPYLSQYVTGIWPQTLHQFHEKYGPVVRFAPNDVSVMGGNSWETVYGFKKGGQLNFPKDLRVFSPRAFGVDMITANDADHSRMRRLFSHAFSEKALRAQEDLLTSYIDLLIQRLKGISEKPVDNVVDLTAWYNFATFDIIGDLTFAESFECLETSNYHPWVKTIFAGLKFGVLNQVSRRYPLFRNIINRFVPKDIMDKVIEQRRLLADKAEHRLSQGEGDRPDFVSYAMKGSGKGVDRGDLEQNLNLLVIAGSETTATLLSGVTYLLLAHPECYKKLLDHVRTTYPTEEDINMLSVGQDKYLLAVLNEALRLYPPVPTNVARLVPKGGVEIEGYHMPEQTSILIPQAAMYRSKRYFTKADDFIPERWLGADEFQNDQLHLVNPFAIGPRNCIGKNLAIAEMRLILARMMWNFDLELQLDSVNWSDQRSFLLWDKPALNVKIVSRAKA